MDKTIMIVDDAEALRQMVAFILQGEGYGVIEAGDGRDALGKLDGRKISLIVSDVNMPEMNGIEFIRTLKEDEKFTSYRFTPVIMLTTESGDSRIEEGRRAGAKAWLVKPFKPEELLDVIKKILG